MRIIFYKVSDPPEKVTKTLSSTHAVDGYLRDESDIMSPVIEVGEDISEYNYMYIQTWGRYYYINGCDVVRTGLFRVKGVKEDVLMSNASEIRAQRCIIDKTESSSLANMYINDGSYVKSVKTMEQKIDFPYGFEADNYTNIVITTGVPAAIEHPDNSGGGGSSTFTPSEGS